MQCIWFCSVMCIDIVYSTCAVTENRYKVVIIHKILRPRWKNPKLSSYSHATWVRAGHRCAFSISILLAQVGLNPLTACDLFMHVRSTKSFVGYGYICCFVLVYNSSLVSDVKTQLMVLSFFLCLRNRSLAFFPSQKLLPLCGYLGMLF